MGAWVAELGGRVVGHVALRRSAADDVAPTLWSEREGVPFDESADETADESADETADKTADETADETAVVSRLFVAPEARGHGIGERLLARAVAGAAELGLLPVLDVVTSDASATALYERTGWRFLGTGEQYWSPRQTVTVRCYAAPEGAGVVPSEAELS